MNIVTPVPTNINFHTANVHTEMARRDNAVREVIPNTQEMANSAKESGLGSESDKLKHAGQQAAAANSSEQSKQQESVENGSRERDNAKDESAQREEAESRQQQKNEQEQQKLEQLEVAELSARDREVRAHEQAHAAVGGQYAGSPTYEFKTGPDGKQYAVAGEVPIDISKTGNPKEDLRKMMQVRAAALAPAQPSPQDMRVAAEATAMAAEARVEIAAERSDSLKSSFQKALDPEAEQDTETPEVNTDAPIVSRTFEALESELKDQQKGVSDNDRKLESDDQVAASAGAEVAPLESNDQVAASAGAEVAPLESDDQVAASAGAEVAPLESDNPVASAAGAEVASLAAERPAEINARATRIANFYQQAVEPKIEGFNQVA